MLIIIKEKIIENDRDSNNNNNNETNYLIQIKNLIKILNLYFKK